MAKIRHGDDPTVRGYAVTHPPGKARLPATQGWDQLLYSASGTMTVHTERGSWAIPPHRALWLPDGVQTAVTNRFRVAVRCLYFARELQAIPDHTSTVVIAGFARELVLHAVRVCPLDAGSPTQAALITVLLDQLAALPAVQLWLPAPADSRAAVAAQLMREDPLRSFADIARTVGASQRTLERAFLADTAMTLGAWRRRLRILSSLDYLGDGRPVSDAALAAGYSTPSAFVTSFRTELGQTPRRFLSG